jgi:hypothetical protein
MIDCSGNTQFITDTWCANIFGYTQAAMGQHKREDDYIPVPAPAQPGQPAPQPVTKVSINVANVSRNGTRADVQLAIQNSGTTEITSVEISGIGLRTLAGAQQASLLDPLPIHVGKLAQGAATPMVVHLDVPNDVKRLELTESGTVTTRENSSYKFSIGQAIFLLP